MERQKELKIWRNCCLITTKSKSLNPNIVLERCVGHVLSMQNNTLQGNVVVARVTKVMKLKALLNQKELRDDIILEFKFENGKIVKCSNFHNTHALLNLYSS